MDELEQGKNGDSAEAKSNIIAEMSRPGQVEAVPELTEFVSGTLKQHGFPEERIEEIKLALQQAFQNILENSYKGKSGEITITCKLDPWGKFMIVIVDSGDPSNVLLADVVFAGEDNPVDKQKKAAAKIIKKMVDNVEYKRVESTNQLTFTVAPRLRSL